MRLNFLSRFASTIRNTPASVWRKSMVVALLCLLFQSAQATLLLQEGFNYTPGGALAGNGGWLNSYSLISVGNNSLAYLGLADTAPAGYQASVLDNPNTGSSTAPFYTYSPFTTVSSGTVYAAFLLDYPSMTGTPNYTFMGLVPASSSGIGNGGTFNSTYDPCDLAEKGASGGYTLGIRSYGQGASYASAVLGLNTTNLIVLKYDFASKTASLFINPSLAAGEPGTPDAASVGSSAAGSIGQIFLRSAGVQAAGGSVDSPPYFIDCLRIGTSWADVVVAVPQPPASKLVFTTQPVGVTLGRVLNSVVVRIRNDNEFNMASNNVPITLSVSAPGTFASGTTTVYSDAYGRATFSDLIVGAAGSFTLNASASGIGAGLAPATSSSFSIGALNVITDQGRALGAFLDSLQVEKNWADGVSVNWLTGASGGSGPNMTTGTASHCSAFAAGAADVLGVYLLRPPDAPDGGLANAQADWLATNPLGWTLVPDSTNAQALANTGALVVASFKEPSGASGHIAILRPSTKSDAEILAYGPEECQSGVHNYNDTNVITGFNQHGLAFATNGIRYYSHAITSPIVPVNPALGSCLISNGVFYSSATSIVGRKYKLQWSSNFLSWADARTFTNSNQSSNFCCVGQVGDPSASGAPRRFYRLLAQ